MKKNKISVLYIVLIVAAVLMITLYLLPDKKAQLVIRAENMILKGDTVGGQDALDQLAALTLETYELKSIQTMKLSLALAGIVQDASLKQQYESFLEQLPPNSESSSSYAEKVQEYQKRGEERHLKFEDVATTYRNLYYQEGLMLNTPFKGYLDLEEFGVSSEDKSNAIGSLMAGIDEQKYHDQLEQAIGVEVIGAVLWMVIEQGDEGTRERVKLSGGIKMPELLLAVSSKVRTKEMAEWYLQRVLDETEQQPDHPARVEAISRLKSISGIN